MHILTVTLELRASLAELLLRDLEPTLAARTRFLPPAELLQALPKVTGVNKNHHQLLLLAALVAKTTSYHMVSHVT